MASTEYPGVLSIDSHFVVAESHRRTPAEKASPTRILNERDARIESERESERERDGDSVSRRFFSSRFARARAKRNGTDS